MKNPCSSRITAAAGTRLAGASCAGTVLNSFLLKEVYNHMIFFPHAILLDQAFAHCPIFPTAGSKEPRPCFSPGVAIHPLRLAKDLRLGKLLSYQLSNPGLAPQITKKSFTPKGLFGIKPNYLVASKLLLTRTLCF